jgi:protein arginine N-methyltransferase 1
MYDIDEYGGMISDRVRTDAYAAALRAAIVPGESVVLDLGTGPGVLAALACLYGARRVHAVESEDVIEVAREIAHANGMSERITFHHGYSTEIELPEPVNVIVSDLHGTLPPFQRHFHAIMDARRRFLAPGGKLIPRRESLWFAVADAPEQHRAISEPWEHGAYGLDLSPAARLAANRRTRATLRGDQLVSAAVRWCDIDYAALSLADCAGEGIARVARAGPAHGLGVWFDSELADGIGFSNAPGKAELTYGTSFFRWPRAIDLRVGDEVRVRLSAKFVGKDYIWSWDTVIVDAAGTTRESFRQSTFFAMQVATEGLRRRAAGFRPSLTEDGAIDRMILEAMSGEASLADIAAAVAARYPARFPDVHEATTRVADVSSRYSR